MGHVLKWSKKIDSDHLELRFKVLRIGMPKGSEHYPGVDDDENTRFLWPWGAQNRWKLGPERPRKQER